MKLSAESTVINDGKLNTNIDNAQTSADSAQTSADNAQETANQARAVADNTAQNFWFKSSGSDTGAHITEIPQAEFEADPSGGNLLARSNGIAIRDGLRELASFKSDGVIIGREIGGRNVGVIITDDSLKFTPSYGASDFVYQREEDLEVVQKYIGDGVTRRFNVFRNNTISVKVNGVVTTAYGAMYSRSDGIGEIIFRTAPADGDVIEISYTTSWGQPLYSFGVNTVSVPYGFAEGRSNTVDGVYAHAEGFENKASGVFAHAQNHGTIASGEAQTSIGKYNIEDNDSVYALIVGNGNDTTRSNAMTVAWNGNTVIAGTLTQSSDRRLKEHISYLGDEAIDFINRLKPAHYAKDGEHHVGFYAQDVAEIDKWDCMTGEMNGYKTLGYMELIAPLVAYVQRLEERIAELEGGSK